MTPTTQQPIIILGATSRIAQDYVASAAAHGHEFALYARRPEAVTLFLAEQGLPAAWAAGTLDDFAVWTSGANAGPRHGIVNFVGVGDPARAKEMGGSILGATLSSDHLALAYLERFPAVRYVFLSSGAVYGDVFEAPVDVSSVAVIPVNALSPQYFYGIAKLHAEASHRARQDLSIIDLRVFNYASTALDIDARFLLTDLARAIRDGTIFDTLDREITRDYLGVGDLVALLDACFAAPAGTNAAADAYTRAPIDKAEMLRIAATEFGLQYRVTQAPPLTDATGLKPHYYSRNHTAAAWGYAPSAGSADVVRQTLHALLAPDRPGLTAGIVSPSVEA